MKAAAVQVTRPIFFASLIIITTYLPLFSFERAEAKLFTPMAYTMGYALFGALLTTLTLVPGLAFYAFRKPGHVYHNRWLEKLTLGYERVLHACLEQPRIIYGVTIFALFAVIGLGGTVGREFLPDLDEGLSFVVAGTDAYRAGLGPRASDMASELRREVRKFPEVSYIVTQTGRNDDGTDSWTMSHIEAPVGLTPYETWHGESKKEFVKKLSTTLAKDLTGFDVGISQPIIDGVNDLIGGAHSPLDALKSTATTCRCSAMSGTRLSTCCTPFRAHLQRLALPGAAHPSDRDKPRSRESGPLWNQHDGCAENVIQTGDRPVSGFDRVCG